MVIQLLVVSVYVIIPFALVNIQEGNKSSILFDLASLYHGHVFLIASTIWLCHNVGRREGHLASNINFSKKYSCITPMKVTVINIVSRRLQNYVKD
jgi:hypothetical protein